MARGARREEGTDGGGEGEVSANKGDGKQQMEEKEETNGGANNNNSRH